MGFAVGQAQAGLFGDVNPVTFDAAPVPFWSAVEAGYRDQTETRNTSVRAEALQADIWDRQRQIEAATGQKLKPSLGMMLGASGDASPEAVQAALALGGLPEDQYEAQIDQLRRARPDAMAKIATREQLTSALDARLKAVRARAEVAGGKQGSGVGTMLGAVGGSFADPVNQAALALTGPLGGARTLAGRIVMGAALNAGIEASSVPLRMADAQVAGPAYHPGEAVQDVAGAAIAGGAFEVGAIGLGALARRLFGGAAEMRGAAQVVDAAARDDAALGPLDGLAHEEGLDALVRGQPKPTVEPARELGDLFGETPTPPGGPEAAGITGDAEYYGRRILQGSFDPHELQADPGRFQYKADADTQGVTARLRGVEAWDPTASGKVLVFEQRDGARFIADGHQRLGLARRLDGEGFDAKLDGFLFREADGWTARQVRTIAALKNIREGSGSILDAAKIFRDAPELARDRSLPVTGDFITQARALARLDPEAFGAVVNGVIPERYGAEIGAMAGDRPDLHAGLVKLLREGQPGALEEARALIHEAKLDDWIAREGEQTDMFGGLPPESTTIARAQVKAAVLNAVRKDARVYGQLVKNADAIEAGGNVLLRDANEAAAAVNRTALEVLSRLSLRSGEVGEAFAKAAREVLDGARPAEAARGITTMVRNRLAAGEALEGLRLTELDPPAPTAAAADLVAKADEPATWEAQAREAPEDAAALSTPGLFDDLGELGAEERAHARLKACAPGE